MTTLLGHVVAVHQLRRAAISRLQQWIEAALVDVARQTGVDEHAIQFPRSWRRLASWDGVPEDQQPVVFATSPSTTGVSGAGPNVTRMNDGRWSCQWEVPILAAVRGQDYEQTAELVSVYAAAIRTVLIQHPPDIDGLHSWWWAGETYDALPAEQQRSWAGALVTFTADVDDVTVERGRRDQPPDDPFAEPTTRDQVVDHRIQE